MLAPASFPFRLARATLAAAVLASTLAASANGQSTATPSSVEVDLDVSTDGTIRAFVHQEWTDTAKSLRQSLDVYFGAGDGTLTPSEIERIERATEEDMRNQTLPWLTADGRLLVQDASVGFADAAGKVESNDSLSMTHDLVLSGSSQTLPRTITLTPLWDAKVRLTLPTGWRVAETTGMQDVTMTTDGATGTVLTSQAATLTLEEATTPVATNESEPIPEETTRRVPAAPFALAALAIALLAGARGRRRP